MKRITFCRIMKFENVNLKTYKIMENSKKKRKRNRYKNKKIKKGNGRKEVIIVGEIEAYRATPH